MTIEEYTYCCQQFANETRAWQSLNPYKYYTTHPIHGWIESCDNAHGGLDVSWAWHYNDYVIKDSAKDMYINVYIEELLTLLDNNVDYNTLRDAITKMFN